MPNYLTLPIVTTIACLLAASPALARPGGWGSARWDRDPAPSARRQPARAAPDRSHEGRVEVARFVGEGDAASLLGHGSISVGSLSPGEGWVGPADRAAYEAAIVESLVRAGYSTDAPAATAGQTIELKVVRDTLQPAETRRSPVSGAAAMEVGTHGTALGLALNIDMSKPLPALVSTRIEARIRDRASDRVLWEGRAEMATREGKDAWSDAKIAARLADALFDGFPIMTDGLFAGG